eukprot:502440_1
MDPEALIPSKEATATNGANRSNQKLLAEPSRSHHSVSRSGLEIETSQDKRGGRFPTKPKDVGPSKLRVWLGYIDRFYMLWMLIPVIFLAAKYHWGHNEGPLYPQISSSWVVTIILFFGIGLGIKIEYLQRACLFWQMILLAHVIIFIYWPCLGWSMHKIAMMMPAGWVSDTMEVLLTGIIILCTLPATAASATVFTVNAEGNEAASAVNCTISNLLAIFLTPGLILIFTGGDTDIDAANVFMNLSLRVIAPFGVAQLIRIFSGTRGRRKIKKFKPYIKKINETSLLYMVFCALSQSFYVGIDATVADALTFLLIIELLHVHGYFMIWFLGGLFQRCFTSFTVFDKVACVYTGVSKSIAMGVPFIEIIYAGTPYVGLYLLPILCYHPSNLIWGSIACEPLKALIRDSGEERIESTLETLHSMSYGAMDEDEDDKAGDVYS